MDVGTTNSVEPITLAAVLAGRLRDRRLIDGPARLAVGAARRPDADADEDGFLLSAFLWRFGGGRHGCSGRFAPVRRSDNELRPAPSPQLFPGAVRTLFAASVSSASARVARITLEQKRGAKRVHTRTHWKPVFLAQATEVPRGSRLAGPRPVDRAMKSETSEVAVVSPQSASQTQRRTHRCSRPSASAAEARLSRQARCSESSLRWRSARATTALQFAQPVRPVSKHICRAEADAPVTAADIEDAAEAAEEAPVVAEEAAAEEKPKRKSKKDATPLDQLVVGDSYDGTITGVAAYGAFVDIGAQSDGFVHISELSTEFVSDVSAVVSEGDAVSVRVLKVDEQKKQLSLSLKPEGAAAPPKRQGGGRRTKKAGADELRKYLDADPKSSSRAPCARCCPGAPS